MRVSVKALKIIGAHLVTKQPGELSDQMEETLRGLQDYVVQNEGSDGKVEVEGEWLDLLRDHAQAHAVLRIPAIACGFEPCSWDADANKRRTRGENTSSAMAALNKGTSERAKRPRTGGR
mmetsp:Transcript_26320/g.61737  ORF Transcript_26320/g.61737 Transcript_26320/m.61737 type:complete len:120 (+) Transcript_26320:263-622(+)